MDKRTTSSLIALLAISTALFAVPLRSFYQVPGGAIYPLQLPGPADVRSGDWKVRRVAFAQLIGAESYAERGLAYIAPVLRDTIERDPNTRETRKAALIELLGIENAVVEKEKSLSEEYLNYYSDVIAAVSNLKDPRALTALLGAITTGGMAIRALISFGTLSVEPVAKKVQSPDSLVRSSASQTLSQMLERSAEISKDPVSRSVIKSALVRAASDKDPIVRRNAVEGLVRLGDQQSIELVEKIARDDPYQANYPGKEGRYIVREAAIEALKLRRPK